MNPIGIMLATTKSGRWKAYAWGQPETHIMDWNGSNYRYASIADQPHSGFATQAEADAWVRRRFSTEEDAEKWIRSNTGDGTHLGDSFHKERAVVDVDLPKKIRPKITVRFDGAGTLSGKHFTGVVVDVTSHGFAVKIGRQKRALRFRRKDGAPSFGNDLSVVAKAEDLPQLESW